MKEVDYSKFAYTELRVLMSEEMKLGYTINEALYAVLRLIPETKPLSKKLLSINSEQLYKAVALAIENEKVDKNDELTDEDYEKFLERNGIRK